MDNEIMSVSEIHYKIKIRDMTFYQNDLVKVNLLWDKHTTKMILKNYIREFWLEVLYEARLNNHMFDDFNKDDIAVAEIEFMDSEQYEVYVAQSNGVN